jgi:hypothetical protein
MNPKKEYARNARKYRNRFLDDCEKQNCKHYGGRKRGCKLDKCCRDDEKLDAIAAGRHK